MGSKFKRRQLDDDDIDLLLGSSDDEYTDEDSDFDPCYLDNGGDTSHESVDEDGSNLSANLGDAANPGADLVDNDWVAQGQLRPRFPFSGDPGIKVNIADTDDPLAYFELFFDETLINVIVQHTNLYAKQYLDLQRATLRKRSRAHNWTETNKKEIKVYLALLLLQGIVQKPVTNLFFSKKQSILTPFFPATMKRERFLLLSKFIHFNDNESYQGDLPHKLFKIWPVLEHLKSKFSSVYLPERDVSVDESLMLWKGRLSWKQYIPLKRARYGIKSYELCESSSGYIWNFFIYTGAETSYHQSCCNEPSMGCKCVLTLAHSLLNKGYCINMDNFFSSPHLFDLLCQNQTDAVGTVRINRQGLPDELKTITLQKGEVFAMYRNKLMALRWRDKKYVSMLSSFHDDAVTEVTVRRKVKQKPQVCLDYNDKMGGVDLSDAYLASYPSARKRLKKYYIKQFRHLMDMAALNSFILYKKNRGEKSRLCFMLALIDRIIEINHMGPNQSSGRPSLGNNPLRLTARHFPQELPPTEKKQHPSRRCIVCYSHKKRKETRFWCRDCEKPLCVDPCFALYHTQKNF